MADLKECIFTGLPVFNYFQSSDHETICYTIHSGNKEIEIRICSGCFDSKISKLPLSKRIRIGGMILRDNINLSTESVFHWEKSRTSNENRIIVSELLQTFTPLSPADKLDGLLISLQQLQLFEGDNLSLRIKKSGDEILVKNYILYEECAYYFSALKENGLIAGTIQNFNDFLTTEIRITFKGLSRLFELQKQNVESNRCFIAMRFDNSTNKIREAIRQVVTAANFDPIFIDERHHDNLSTINDAMIAEMRKSRFCIADFTEQVRGVYFESGFMMGQNKKVIFTCLKEYFDDKAIADKRSHFDTNHFPHIIYSDVEELKIKLRDKIDAWIK